MGNLCNGNVKDQTYEEADTDEPQPTPRGDDETYLFKCWEKAINVADEHLIAKLLTKFSTKVVNHAFSNGDYAIHICAKKGYKEIIDDLLVFGDKITKKNSKTGNTVLHYAVEKRDYKLCLFLINKGFGGHDLMEMENNKGKIPYDIAKKTNDKLLIAAVTPDDLIRHPKTNYKRSEAKSLVDKEKLIKPYYKVNLFNSWEKAIYDGDEDATFELLYDHASDLLGHEFSDGNFAIHICAKKGYFNLMWHLLEYGDDMTRQNSKNGNTALHYAVETGNKKIVEFLFLKSQFKGCKINEIKNNDGKLAYDYALKTNDEDLITFVTPVDKRNSIDNIWFSALGFDA